jgi:hypothetical protein
MPEAKTKLNDASVSDFLNKIPDQQLRSDCHTLVKIMQSAANGAPRMWGSSIIGFGEHNIVYAGGRESTWMMIGFAPRKQNIALYIGSSFPEHDRLLPELGKHSTGKGCLYIKKLSDVHLPVLEQLVSASVRHKLKPSAAATSSKKTPLSKASSVAKSKASSLKASPPKSSSPKSTSKARTSAGSKPKSRLKAR